MAPNFNRSSSEIASVSLLTGWKMEAKGSEFMSGSAGILDNAIASESSSCLRSSGSCLRLIADLLWLTGAF